MSESSYHSNHRDRYPASHHRHHHRDRSRGYERRDYQDDRESGRSDRSQKRVPGHVSDPEKEENESDSVIGRGQRETVDRYRTRRTNSDKKQTKPSVKDNNSSGSMSPYDGKLATITQPNYYVRDGFDIKKSSRTCNSVLLSFLPGVVGVGCILAAIILIDWMVQVNEDMVVTFGLFQVCTQQIINPGGGREALTCQSSESFANAGSELSSLEQATRGLIIIAALIGFISLCCSLIFGFNRFYRKWGALVVGGLYAFSGAVAVAAMGTYSSFLTTQFTDLADTVTVLVTGGSFYLGWFGTACYIVGSITAFVSHCV